MMACNSCAKLFSFFRKEKGCPGCGFSYCSQCLNNKVLLPKLNAEAKVCAKCKQCPPSDENKQIYPPDAYYKRLAALAEQSNSAYNNSKDKEILKRLQNLKKGSNEVVLSEKVAEEDIVKRLQAIKGEVPSVSDEELQIRLAKLRGHPAPALSNKTVLPAQDMRTDQEQADDLLKQYMEQTKIDSTYNNEFNKIINGIESRMQKLKNISEPLPSSSQQSTKSEDEEEIVRNIIEKVKAESLLDDNDGTHQTNDELPFCEICNEDASLRCLGCKYLFCKRCFREHRDDDGCDSYESYKPPNNN